MIVLDTNILIRATIGVRVRELMFRYASTHRFVSPESAFREALENLPVIFRKRGIFEPEGLSSFAELIGLIERVDPSVYSPHEAHARVRLEQRDPDDWPVLATALALNAPIWTEDADFFGTGVATWTTSNVELFLSSPAGAAS